MRSLFYWLASTFVAVLASRAAERGDSLMALAGEASSPLFALPDSDRSVLLGVGIMAMAYAYRQAWLGWRQRA